MIGTALHELAANAIVHGALRQEKGELTVRWSINGEPEQGRTLGIEWTETGVPTMFDPSPKQGMGLEVLEQGLSYTLQASTTLAFAPERFSCFISIPLNTANNISV